MKKNVGDVANLVCKFAKKISQQIKFGANIQFMVQGQCLSIGLGMAKNDWQKFLMKKQIFKLFEEVGPEVCH